MAKYLVTGGAGFIGSNLVRFLLEKGRQVVVVDNYATGKPANLASLDGRYEMMEADIRDRSAMDAAVEGAVAIFHEAALGSVPRSVANPAESHDVNVNGTVTVLEAARAAGVKRVIFAGSSSAYGEQPASPKVETMVPQPLSPYAANKVACEAYMRAYAGVFGMETLTLRYFNVFGPRQDPEGAYAAVIPRFVSALLRGERPTVYGDGEQSRDFCYIDNVCQANWLAANAPADACRGQALNIACHQRTTLNEILRILGELLKATPKPRYEPPRAGDVKHSLADYSLAAQTIGYNPMVMFEEGLRRSIEWYKANL